MPPETSRPTGDQVLAKLPADHTHGCAYTRRRTGVGKTYSMIDDAHAFRREGLAVVIGFVETHGRAETEARIATRDHHPTKGDTGRRLAEWTSTRFSRGARALRRRRLAHTNAPRRAREALSGRCRNDRFCIGVMTAVNIQHSKRSTMPSVG